MRLDAAMPAGNHPTKILAVWSNSEVDPLSPIAAIRGVKTSAPTRISADNRKSLKNPLQATSKSNADAGMRSKIEGPAKLDETEAAASATAIPKAVVPRESKNIRPHSPTK